MKIEDFFNKGVWHFEKREYQKAYANLLKAAQKGNIDAMYMIAKMLKIGIGVEQNREKKLFWFENAAKRGHIKSMLFLALYHYKVTKDDEQMMSWFESAAKNSKNSKYMYKIATIYLRKKSFQNTYKWLTKAYKIGNLRAYYKLGTLYENGFGSILKDDKKAFKIYRDLSKSYPKAMSKLAIMYIKGRGGVSVNMKKAAKLALNAKNLGEDRAKNLFEEYQLSQYC